MGTKLLNFQKEILAGLIEDDALVILAKGLGVRSIIASFLSVHADPQNLVLFVDADQEEDDLRFYQKYIAQCLQLLADCGEEVQKNKRTCFKYINNEYNSEER
jgi:hypothetical protein